MRETFKILSHALADKFSSSIADERSKACSSSSAQNFLISDVVIVAFIFATLSVFAKRSCWILRACTTRFLISAEDSPALALRKSSIGNAEASTWISILSSNGPESLAR